MKNLFFIAIFTFVLSGCSKEDSGTPLIENSFDNIYGWTPGFLVSKEVQHSGQYSFHILPESEYTMGYTASVGETMNSKVRKITLEYYLYTLKPDADFHLVFEIVRPDNSKLIWSSSSAKEVVKEAKKWTKVSTTFEIPSNIPADFVVKCYGWNRNKSEYYLDDIKVFGNEK